MVDPVTALAFLSFTKSGLGFIGGRIQDKQTLQELNTNRLLAQLKGLSTSNQINDMTDETLADNITVGNTSGYAPLDSASFRAIQKRVTDKGKKDLLNTKLSTEIAVNSINQSLSNLNKKMIMSEIGFGVEIASMSYSHSNFMKNRDLEEAYRTKEAIYRDNTIKALKKQRAELSSNLSLLRKSQFNQKILFSRVLGSPKRHHKGYVTRRNY